VEFLEGAYRWLSGVEANGSGAMSWWGSTPLTHHSAPPHLYASLRLRGKLLTHHSAPPHLYASLRLRGKLLTHHSAPPHLYASLRLRGKLLRHHGFISYCLLKNLHEFHWYMLPCDVGLPGVLVSMLPFFFCSSLVSASLCKMPVQHFGIPRNTPILLEVASWYGLSLLHFDVVPTLTLNHWCFRYNSSHLRTVKYKSSLS
jgi:hypothetical protein